MAVNDATHALVFLVYLAVYESLCVAFWGIWIDGTGVANSVLFDVFAIRDECGSERFGDEESIWVLWVADRDVAVCLILTQ